VSASGLAHGDPVREPPEPAPRRPDPYPEQPEQPAYPQYPQQPEPYGPGPWVGQPYGGGAPVHHDHGEPALPYGGRLRRLIAGLIDGLVVYVVTWLLTAPLLGVGSVYEGSLARRTGADLITAVVAFLYYALQHARWGRTPGKRVMNLRVVRERDGGPISYGQASWRLLFAYLISVVTCGVGGLIDVAWILWDRRRQALHDKVARTVVVEVTPDMPDPYAR
jgi:uncharacterized RDD family membrane protein YckC